MEELLKRGGDGNGLKTNFKHRFIVSFKINLS